MKSAAAVTAILILLLPVPGFPAAPTPSPGAPAAPESLEAIEKDLSAILTEMDAIRTELDRIGELSAMPKATGVRIEILGAGGVPAPAAFRFLVAGKTEDEREFGKAERDAFAGGSSPLIVHLPLLPGSYKARIELSHPYWKAAAAADFPVAVTPGTVASLRFRLSAPGGKGSPVLAPAGGK